MHRNGYEEASKMYISRIVIRNFRNFKQLDVALQPGVTCVIGENNTGKSNLLHAIRLAVDANLSSTFRQLLEHDIHHDVSLSTADQVVISVEFKDFEAEVGECALVGCCRVDDDVARISYRYRPITKIREMIEADEHSGKDLSLAEDYHFEISGGGANDPATVDWNEELGSQIRFGDMQAYQVEYLPALRDVQQSLRQSYSSPLSRLLGVSGITDNEKDDLVEILRNANKQLESQSTISKTGEAIHNSFTQAVGEAYNINVRLGLTEPSFTSISRSLTVLLSNDSLKDFDPSRNGLGLNNILYISMLLDYFQKRVGSLKSAGQLLLIEEPEAHLHPQLQRVLYSTLAATGFQAIVTTHSTHISSHAPVGCYVVLTNEGKPATAACVPTSAAGLTDEEVADLERFLDATRSTLLYARKVLLVEGPAELFLIPPLVKKVMGVDLDRHGISVVPIYGKHFALYAKLFGPGVLRKKCAIICDGDDDPASLDDGVAEDTPMAEHEFTAQENDFLQVYACPVTFERAVTTRGTLPIFEAALEECEYPEAVAAVKAAQEPGSSAIKAGKLAAARSKVLASAKRCGKARFAQIASKYVDQATSVPDYIKRAVDWLLED